MMRDKDHKETDDRRVNMPEVSQNDTTGRDDADHPKPYTGPERRTSVVDRRVGLDRRRGPGRRRTDDRRSAEEGQMSDEQFEFLMAIDEYKRANSRPFPTWTEVLEVIKALGYRKVAEPHSLDASQPRPSEPSRTATMAKRRRKVELAK
jgi:hypothetical protein